MGIKAQVKKLLLVLAAMLYLGAGCLHFLKASVYLQIMPPYVPWPLEMVYISGAAEVIGGIGLLFPKTKRWAGWWVTGLLIAVFPANVYMAMGNVQVMNGPIPRALLWARLPVQAVLIWWVLWCTTPAKRG